MNKNIHNLLSIPTILSGRATVDKSMMEECDFEFMAQVSYEQLILSLFYDTYKDFMKSELSELCLGKIKEYEKKKRIQLMLLERIKDEFEINNIDYLLIKGFMLDKIIYKSRGKRWFGDLDIIIELSDFKKANEIMERVGFKKVLGDVDIPDLSQLDCYEIDYEYSPDTDFFTSVEIKTATSSIRDKVLIEYLKDNKVKMDLNGFLYNTLGMNETFILLCTNAYSNFEIEFASARLREIFDLYFFIFNYMEKLDWQKISEMSIKFKITHKIYAILILLNEYYIDLIPNNIINIFSVERVSYDKSSFNNFYHCWMRDWNISKLDIMLNNRKTRWMEMFFGLSLKAYSSRNSNFNNLIYVSDEKNKELLGIKSERSEFSFKYSFKHSEDNIILYLKFDIFNIKNQIRTVFLVHDLDREMPRKMFEIFYENEIFKCRDLTGNSNFSVIESSKEGISVSIEKKSFKVLLNKGHLLAYRFYSVRRFGNNDFAIKDDRDSFDFENPNVLYLCTNNTRQVIENIKEYGLFYYK